MIRLVYADRHAENHPTDREMPDYARGFPELPSRATIIRDAIQSEGLGEFISPKEFGMEFIQAVHDPGLLEHLKTGYAQSRHGPDDHHPYIAHTFAVHGRRDGKGDHPSAFGAWAFDTSGPLLEKTWDATVQASHAALTAAEHVAKTKGVAYSLGRPPGHHAGRHFYGGFCYLNHAAVAAEYLKQTLRGNVATLDIDYHHGNGTQEIFYADREVLTVSLHADPKEDYPFFWGGEDERGDGEGKNINLPLPIGTKDSDYLKSLDVALLAIAEHRPNALVVSAGFDLMTGDPVPRNGGFKITMNGLKQIGAKIASLKLPTVIVQEGGYNLKKLGDYAVTLLESFER